MVAGAETTTHQQASHRTYQILHLAFTVLPILAGLNLLLIPGYYDIALRGFGLTLGALSLAHLAVAAEAAAGSSARMQEARI